MINRILIFLILLCSLSASAQIAPLQDTVPSSKSKPIVPTFRQDIVNGQRINYIYNPLTGKYDALLPANYIRKYITGGGSTVDTTSLSNRINKKQNQLINNIADLGAKGDSTAHAGQTAIINTALANGAIYVPYGNFIIDSLVNKHGFPIYGPGRLIRFYANEQRLLNPQSDQYQYTFGQEYLSHLHNIIDSNNALGFKVVLSGPSTTAGDATTPHFHLDSIMTRMAFTNGLYGAQFINAGHSGMGVVQWINTYLDQDMAENPSAYVLQWSINDALNYAQSDKAADYFLQILEIGLQRIRGSYYNKPLSAMSIILQTSNATSGDATGHKANVYYERIAAGLRVLARKYFCVFDDSGAKLNDPYHSEFMQRLSNPDGSAVYIHPLNVLNIQRASELFDVMFPNSVRSYGVKNNEPNIPTGSVLNVAVPDAYSPSLNIDFATQTGGFPMDGTLTTIKQKAATAGQFLVSYGGGDSTKVAVRGGFIGNWQRWNSLLTEEGVQDVTSLKRFNGGVSTTGDYFNIYKPLIVSSRLGALPSGNAIVFAVLNNDKPDPLVYFIGQSGKDTYERFGGNVHHIKNAVDVDVATFNGASSSFTTVGKHYYTTNLSFSDADSLALPTKFYVDTHFAPTISPSFQGSPTAPTPPTGTSNTQLATTEFVKNTVLNSQVNVSSASNLDFGANGYYTYTGTGGNSFNLQSINDHSGDTFFIKNAGSGPLTITAYPSENNLFLLGVNQSATISPGFYMQIKLTNNIWYATMFRGLDKSGNQVGANAIIMADNTRIEKSPNGTWYWIHSDDDGTRLQTQVSVTIDSSNNATIIFP